jgi:hypothetical protein
MDIAIVLMVITIRRTQLFVLLVMSPVKRVHGVISHRV